MVYTFSVKKGGFMNHKIICQSCSMPLEKEEQFGTNADKSKNKEYCIYCFSDGKFKDDITLEEMIEECANIMSKMENIEIEEAKSFLKKVIPNLKRWKK